MNNDGAFKVRRVIKFFKNLKFFWYDAENDNNDVNILKNIFVFGFLMFFAIFEFFLKFNKT